MEPLAHGRRPSARRSLQGHAGRHRRHRRGDRRGGARGHPRVVLGLRRLEAVARPGHLVDAVHGAAHVVDLHRPVVGGRLGCAHHDHGLRCVGLGPVPRRGERPQGSQGSPPPRRAVDDHDDVSELVVGHRPVPPPRPAPHGGTQGARPRHDHHHHDGAGGRGTDARTAARPVLAPTDPVDTLVAPATPPPAPLATGAQAFVDSALVTWKPPAGTTATGYDVYVGLSPGMEYPVPLNGANPVVGDSYLVTGLTPGRIYYFTVRGRVAGASSSASNEVSAIPFNAYTPVGTLVGPVISMASTADGTGYWLATASGAISTHGSATDLGSTAGLTLAAPIVKIVADPKADGYWEVAADGGVFAYGDAPFEGAASSLPLVSPSSTWSPRPTASATGRSPLTVACSPTAMPPSGAHSAPRPRRRPPSP